MPDEPSPSGVDDIESQESGNRETKIPDSPHQTTPSLAESRGDLAKAEPDLDAPPPRPTLRTQNIITADAIIKRVEQKGMSTGQLEEGPLVTVRHKRRRSVYYSVTKEEIDSYSQFSVLSTILLTLFGATIGATITAVAAVLQGGLDPVIEAIFETVAWLTGIASILFAAVALYLHGQARKVKQAWQEGPESG